MYSLFCFQESLEHGNHASQKGKRFLHRVYHFVCRSLLKSDRFMFALHLIHHMFPDRFQKNVSGQKFHFVLTYKIYVIGIQSTNSSTTMSIVTDFRKINFFPSYSYLPLNFFTPSNFSISQEWELLTGAVIVSDTKSSDPLPAWIEQDRAFNLFLLQSALPSLYNKLNLSSESLWRSFMKHDGILPDHCEELTAFQKALVTHCLKPDQTYSALTRFALESLGEISFSSLLRMF